MRYLISALFYALLASNLAAEEISVQSKGMVCQSCVNRITKQLKKYEHVERVAVDLDTQKVQITTKENQTITDIEIKDAFTRADLAVVEIKR